MVNSMSMWSNKHVVIAMLMAPVLALIAYFGMGAWMGEDAIVAEPGQSYQLVEKPNCRYQSGLCGLKNNKFELTITFERSGSGYLFLKLESSHPLEGVLLAHVRGQDKEDQPVQMNPVGAEGLSWSLEMETPNSEQDRIHLVASAGGAFYFGDVATKFMGAKATET